PDLIPLLTPPTLRILAQSDVNQQQPGLPRFSNSTIYQASTGARVFSAGTITWSWGLADMEEFGQVGFSNQITHRFADRRLKRFTSNLLYNFITGIEPGGARIGVLKREGIAFVKEGPLNATWWAQSSQVVGFALDDDRIGLLEQNGNVRVRDGIFGTELVWE